MDVTEIQQEAELEKQKKTKEVLNFMKQFMLN